MTLGQFLLLVTFGISFLVPSVSAKEASAPISQEWKESTLSPKTLEKVNEAVRSYQDCLNVETRRHIQDLEDSRKVTDRILSACDAKLAPAKTAFNAEKVPETISDRYLRRKRSQAAQQVVREVMGAHALRYREAHP